MRLIDGDSLYETLHEIRMDEVAKYGRNDTKNCCSLSTALYEIQNTPTIDPVKHGRWEMGGGYLFPNWTCSRCKCIFCGTEEFPKKYKFCPQCGTRMDEE